MWTDTVGDAFSGLAGVYLERERIRATNPAATNDADYKALTNRRDDVVQRVNVEPGQTMPSDRVAVGGVQLNKTALLIGGGALVAAVLLKVLK